MKHLLKSSLVLMLFSGSVMLFNLSCEKEAEAQTTSPTITTVQNVGLILFLKAGDKFNEVWVAKYDGTSQVKITIAGLPANADVDRTNMKISPDGKKLFFNVYLPSTNVQTLYSCNIDGSGLVKIIDNTDEICAVI